MSPKKPAAARPPAIPTLVAAHARRPVRIDGSLRDPVWREAPAHAMALPADVATNGRTVAEGGRVRAAWDSRWFYLGVDFDDSDVVAEGKADGLHHYALGDVAELFLWPEDQTWYWEMYVTPTARQTTFFFPGGGRGSLPSCFKRGFRLKVGAKVDGTLNRWTDRDRGWTAEMAVPVKHLTAYGDAWGPGSRWRILVGRYNYSRYLPAKECSCYPLIPKSSFHLREAYARIVFAE